MDIRVMDENGETKDLMLEDNGWAIKFNSDGHWSSTGKQSLVEYLTSVAKGYDWLKKNKPESANKFNKGIHKLIDDLREQGWIG